MKGKFDAYVRMAKKFQNWIVDRSTARDFVVSKIRCGKIGCSYISNMYVHKKIASKHQTLLIAPL